MVNNIKYINNIEFLAANIKEEDILHENILRKAFDFFDEVNIYN